MLPRFYEKQYFAQPLTPFTCAKMGAWIPRHFIEA